MTGLNRRLFLTLLASGLLTFCIPFDSKAKDGDGHSGSGGGGSSGSGGGDDDNSGPGGGDDDDDHSGPGGGDDDEDEDKKGQDAVRKAVSEGKAVPLRKLLTIVRREYPGDVVDVRLNKGRTLTYRLKILDSRGRLLSVSVDAATGKILRAQSL